MSGAEDRVRLALGLHHELPSQSGLRLRPEATRQRSKPRPSSSSDNISSDAVARLVAIDGSCHIPTRSVGFGPRPNGRPLGIASS